MRAGSSISVTHLAIEPIDRAVVELLERLALAHVAPDLADEQDQRGGVLLGNVDAGGRIGGARPAGDEADAGPPGELADRLRHHGGAALLAADRHLDRAVEHGVERRDVALARHAEHVARAVDHELIDQHFGGGPRSVVGTHEQAPALFQGSIPALAGALPVCAAPHCAVLKYRKSGGCWPFLAGIR